MDVFARRVSAYFKTNNYNVKEAGETITYAPLAPLARQRAFGLEVKAVKQGLDARHSQRLGRGSGARGGGEQRCKSCESYIGGSGDECRYVVAVGPARRRRQKRPQHSPPAAAQFFAPTLRVAPHNISACGRFEGNLQASKGQAAALTFYAFVGLLCTGLVLSIAVPAIGDNAYSLVLISPGA
jgi:hypothetical protein